MLQELTVQTTYLLRELELERGRRASEALGGSTAWTWRAAFTEALMLRQSLSAVFGRRSVTRETEGHSPSA
jgi:hypothetical protein